MRVVNHHLCKRGKTYYFIKRVPKDVRRLHSSPWIKESLKTNDLPTARRARDQLLKQLEAKWSAYRALPEGKYISREQLNAALDLRSHVLSGKDREGWLQVVNERTVEIYDEDVPWQLNGEVASEVASEFNAIASGNKLSVGIAVEQFLTSANLKPSTRSLYRGLLRQLEAEFSFLEDMTREAVRKFLRSYQSTRTSKAISNMVTAARSLLAFHDIDPNVFAGHRLDPGKRLVKKGIWTDAEIVRLINADGPEWLTDCIILAAYSGMRRQEVCGLVYDADKDQLVVEAGNAKTHNSIRRVPCHPLARDAAKRISGSSQKIGKNRLTVAMRELTDRLDIARSITIDGEPFKRDFHALRHTFASKLASMGVEQSVIGRIIGHAPTNVTGRYASKVDPEMDRPVIAMIHYGG